VGTLPALPISNKGVTPQIALVAIGRSPERSFLCLCFYYYPAIKKSGAWAPDWVIALREDKLNTGLPLKRSSVAAHQLPATIARSELAAGTAAWTTQ
jgi:hypothetical protein